MSRALCCTGLVVADVTSVMSSLTSQFEAGQMALTLLVATVSLAPLAWRVANRVL
ncbi:hypothetical protein Mal4_55250 [Maioricimonas rarisocia]|uniref:Uncharacterized protein n=1 Tax=Maioricimonas rarisocia TaxID=2528026 RepID=A0A517ZF92_9PLAN|nr:hypothetical protein [Maioricimonas rarisocia]QDU41160.1 hypothetical protein Mal4_55250 [Maioricimonas rarisocia]